MIANDLIQAALVARLKGMAAFVALLGSKDDLKEAQWQGTTFVYPAFRIRMGTQVPQAGYGCAGSSIPFSLICKTEDASSLNVNNMAGIAAQLLHGATWCDIFNGVRFVSIRAVGIINAVREDERTWKAEASFQAIVEPAAKAP